jgi:carbonic anhydrase
MISVWIFARRWYTTAHALYGLFRLPPVERITMRVLSHLFANNRAWSAEMTRQDPDFFRRMSVQQTPQYLWISCSDSRMSTNHIVGLLPGEMFVHRNVANVVVHTDLNCLSAIQFAVDVLRVGHIIVCGHYGCGGVLAALRDDKLGLIDNWLRHVQNVRAKHQAELDGLADEKQRHNRLCELNVVEQVVNVSQTTIVRDVWARGQTLAVHGWIYALEDGLLRDLDMCVTGESEIPALLKGIHKGREPSS